MCFFIDYIQVYVVLHAHFTHVCVIHFMYFMQKYILCITYFSIQCNNKSYFVFIVLLLITINYKPFLYLNNKLY